MSAETITSSDRSSTSAGTVVSAVVFKFNHTDNPDLPHAQVIDTATNTVLYSEFDKAAYDSRGVTAAMMVKTLESRYKEFNEKETNRATSAADSAHVAKASSKASGSGKDNSSGSKKQVRRKV